MASPNTERLREQRMVRVYRLDEVGAKCKTMDGALYQKTKCGAVIRLNKDERSAKERKRAKRK